MKETPIMRDIMIRVSSPEVRVFRNNVALAWAGSKVTRNKDGSITIQNPRPIHAGLCKGSSDLIGWKSVLVTPEMVGGRLAVFTAIEVKGTKTRIEAEQTNFIDCVRNHGGLAGIARSVDDALTITNQL